jgi:hypothetical protein
MGRESHNLKNFLLSLYDLVLESMGSCVAFSGAVLWLELVLLLLVEEMLANFESWQW